MTTCMQLLVGGGHVTFSRCFPQDLVETKMTATGEEIDLHKLNAYQYNYFSQGWSTLTVLSL